MLFSEMYKVKVNKVTFVGFRRLPPLDPPLNAHEKSEKDPPKTYLHTMQTRAMTRHAFCADGNELSLAWVRKG